MDCRVHVIDDNTGDALLHLVLSAATVIPTLTKTPQTAPSGATCMQQKVTYKCLMGPFEICHVGV